MKTFKSVITISTLLLFTTSVFAASHAGAPMAKVEAKKEAATAVPASADMADAEVRKIDKENKKITLKHGVIKNLDMPGMTMVFQVKDASLLDNIKAGDKIKFTAESVNGAMTVLSVQKNP
jgi:Cu(I)/Ag(I) efflux system protein CusF